MVKILRQAGPDNRGELHAPLAQESGANPGRDAKGHVDSATLPTLAQSNDPHISGEVKDWFDGIVNRWLDDKAHDAQLRSEIAEWVCPLDVGQFAKASRALSADECAHQFHAFWTRRWGSAVKLDEAEG